MTTDARTLGDFEMLCARAYDRYFLGKPTERHLKDYIHALHRVCIRRAAEGSK